MNIQEAVEKANEMIGERGSRLLDDDVISVQTIIAFTEKVLCEPSEKSIKSGLKVFDDSIFAKSFEEEVGNSFKAMINQARKEVEE